MYASESPMQVAEVFEKMPRVNAVEVLDKNGSGVLLYPDWP